MIKLLVVEDNAIVRRGLISILEREQDIIITGEAENGVDALSLLNTGTIATMVLADLNMPVMDGIELTTAIHKVFPYINVVVLTMHAKQDFVTKAKQAGARGFLLKHLNSDELVDALRRIAKGAMIFM